MREPTTSQTCADASFLFKLAVPEGGSDIAEEQWVAWIGSGTSVVSPSLLPYELISTVRKRVHREMLSIDEASEALETLLGLRVSLVSSLDLHRAAWEIATQLNHPVAYDAHYLALASQLDCPFWTADRDLFDDAQGLGLEAHFVG